MQHTSLLADDGVMEAEVDMVATEAVSDGSTELLWVDPVNGKYMLSSPKLLIVSVLATDKEDDCLCVKDMLVSSVAEE